MQNSTTVSLTRRALREPAVEIQNRGGEQGETQGIEKWVRILSSAPQASYSLSILLAARPASPMESRNIWRQSFFLTVLLSLAYPFAAYTSHIIKIRKSRPRKR